VNARIVFLVDSVSILVFSFFLSFPILHGDGEFVGPAGAGWSGSKCDAGRSNIRVTNDVCIGWRSEFELELDVAVGAGFFSRSVSG
jgi:hypothetical protein